MLNWPTCAIYFDIQNTNTHTDIKYSSDRFILNHKFPFTEVNSLIDKMTVFLCVFCNYNFECIHKMNIDQKT